MMNRVIYRKMLGDGPLTSFEQRCLYYKMVPSIERLGASNVEIIDYH